MKTVSTSVTSASTSTSKTSDKTSNAARRRTAALLAAFAGSAFMATATSAAVITVRSGQTVPFPGISPGVPGNIDGNTRAFIVNPVTQPLFTAANYAAANSGFSPTVITPYFPPSIWATNLGALDPQARWINFEFTNNFYGYPGSALYSAPFFVPGSGPIPATMTLKLAVDDYLGDWAVTGNNPAGVHLNGVPLTPNFTAANYNTPTTYTKSVILNGGTTNYLQLYQRDVGSLVSGIIFSADFTIPNSNGCYPKPSGMSLWLPFDDTTGVTSLNVVDATHPGARINGPTTVLGQRVGNSLDFDGINDYVEVGTSTAYPGIDPGTGSFTIDAWVKKATVDSTIQVIVDHRQENFGPVLGYSWFLGGSNNQALQLGDAGGFVNWPGGSATAIPGDNKWHLAAVVVNRGTTTPTATFYVDGVAVGTPVNISAVPGNINPPAGTPFRVGSRSSSVSGNFRGGIDEVEFFPRALTALEIAKIYKAGAAGKCKNEVKAPATSYCRGTLFQPVTAWVCNNTNAPAFYSWNFSTLGVGPGCTFAGPTGFLPASGVLGPLAPGACAPVSINIFTPTGQPNFTTSCYAFTATNTSTGEATSATGKLTRWCGILPTDPTNPTLVSTNLKSLPVAIVNEESAPIELTYRVRIQENDLDDDGISDVPGSISLNGLPPGEPYIGTLSIAPGTIGEVPVAASFDAPEGSSLYTILIEADTTGTGDFQAFQTIIVTYGEDIATCPCAADFDGSGGTPDAGDVDAFFVAWLSGDATADADCSGGTPDAGDVDIFFQQWLAGGC
jgi:hypothetical protein